MEFVNGGTLFYWMRKMGLFTEPQARFFAGELLLALEHLHSHNIVHRDLKPENILLRPSGHLVLTDFGCAKEYREALPEEEQAAHMPAEDGGDSVRIGALSRSMVGTEAYMAPEVIKREEHGVAIDLWSFGVLLFEMLTGDLPYYHRNKAKMIEAIKVAKKPKFPKFLSSEAVSLIKTTVEKDASKRPAAVDIKSHRFFAEINWRKLINLEVSPPVVPTVPGGPMDISNIAEKYTKDEPAVDSPVSPSSLLSPTKAGLFSGFTYEDDSSSVLLESFAADASATVADLAMPASPTTLSPGSSSAGASGRRLTELDLDATAPGSPCVSDDGGLFELSPSLESADAAGESQPTRLELDME